MELLYFAVFKCFVSIQNLKRKMKLLNIFNLDNDKAKTVFDNPKTSVHSTSLLW